MSTTNFGDQLFGLTHNTVGALFNQSELVQLTYNALGKAAKALAESTEEEIKVVYAGGMHSNGEPLKLTRNYNKQRLQAKYDLLANYQLNVNGLFQLVAIVEALLTDVVRAVLREYPKKLGAKRTMTIQSILESSSIEAIHMRASDAVVNDLAYKSASDFSDEFKSLLSINLLECPSFEKYVEIKASRDIFIHNKGIANDIYVRKAGENARVEAGEALPADGFYFLESYEYCLVLTEWLEKQFHEKWYSPRYLLSQATKRTAPDGDTKESTI